MRSVRNLLVARSRPGHGRDVVAMHGCTPVHTGCAHSGSGGSTAAVADFGRTGRPFVVPAQRQASHFGRGRPRRVTAESAGKLPVRWARAAAEGQKRMLVAPLDCDPLDAEVTWTDTPGRAMGLRRGRQEFDRFMDLISRRGRGIVRRDIGKAPGITW